MTRLSDQERVENALSVLHGRVRADAIAALEAVASATEMIPTGGGSADVKVSGGFESQPPGELHLLAAEVVREAQAAFRRVSIHAARLRRHASRERQMTFSSSGVGRPRALNVEMVTRAKELAFANYRVTAIVRVVALEYGVSESALWKARERGETAEVGCPEREWTQVLSKADEPCERS